MARKIQISREKILEAAFQLLVQEGYGAINITSLAKKIGCSTQPMPGILETWKVCGQNY